jgi:2-methylcitrate dehydratase PrpD
LSNTNITEQFTEGIYQLAQQPLSPEITSIAKACLVDYLAVTLAGSVMASKTRALLSNTKESVSPVIGWGEKTSLLNAALINGIHSHVAELDDGERSAMMHPGTPVLSALLSVAAVNAISGTDLLRGIVCGYEASVRLASTLQPDMKDRGYHATGVCGAIGAAVAVTVAMNGTLQQLKDAISAAATSSSGILKAIKDVSELKPYNVGKAAMNGVLAYQMAEAGFSGPEDVMEGPMGFLQLFSKQPKLQHLEFTHSGPLGIERIYRKPYAACRHCHSPIEAALNLKAQHNIDPNAIENVVIETYFWAVGGHEHTDILGSNSAKMSIPYSVAVALATGNAHLNEFTPAYYENPDILRLTRKVNVEAREDLTALVPQKRAAIVHITTPQGTYTERVDLPKGEPENPITQAELQQKFFALATYGGKSENECRELMQCIDEIEQQSSAFYSLL